jgi:hypothetical protein|tara:strand:+ start:8832 stop:9092 length:261 start_codon:yes stop_codon:yes gene_type:complete
VIFLDFLLEEEMIDILTYCLQNPDSDDVDSKKQRLKEIGKELFNDGGVDAMENFFFVVENRIIGEIEKDPKPFRNLWNGITNEWNY